MITLKTQEQIELMRKSGQILADTHAKMRELVRPGITTLQLDRAAEDFIRSHGAIPSFKGFQGFPASVCASVDDEVVHGIPTERVLNEGSIIGLDIGTILGGWHADSAQTLPVGKISPQVQRLLEITEEALFAGIKAAVVGNRLGDISRAIEKVGKKAGFGIVRDLVGHGIGRQMHEEPQVPNFSTGNKGVLLQEGMTLAIEPMFNLGTHKVKVDLDGWTIRTTDGKLSAHFEHTIAICKWGPEVLTRS